MNSSAFPGERLRERREELGLSVEDVYRKLRIPFDAIDAFERGDTGAFPEACFAAGFLRTYCNFLDIDSDKYLAIIQQCAAPESRFQRLATSATNAAWFKELAAWAGVCGIVILGWITYAIVFQPDAQPDSAAQAETREMRVPSTALPR
jgi:cytoskeletal protein RodZ